MSGQATVAEIDRRVGARIAACGDPGTPLRGRPSRLLYQLVGTAGIRRIVAALDEVHSQTPGLRTECLLETTAGQGTSLGWRFEHLAAMLNGVADPEPLGRLLRHLPRFRGRLSPGHARGVPGHDGRPIDRIVRAPKAGSPLSPQRQPSRELGSRVVATNTSAAASWDLEPFRNPALPNARFRDVPMYLETPKGEEQGADLDATNLATLRRAGCIIMDATVYGPPMSSFAPRKKRYFRGAKGDYSGPILGEPTAARDGY